MAGTYYEVGEYYEIRNDDNTARFLLGKKGNNIVYCIGVNPSTATLAKGEPDDPTINRVEKIAAHNGFDGWVMLNLYPQRATKIDRDKLHKKMNESLADENSEIIQETLKKASSPQKKCTVWLAFGSSIEKRAYLRSCLTRIYEDAKDLNIRWVRAGELTKHPLHPIARNGISDNSPFEDFDIETYLKKHGH